MLLNLNQKYPLIFVFVLIVLIGVSTDALGQRKSGSRRTPKPAPKPNALALDIRSGAEDVAIQVKNLTKFVFVLGGVATGIEEIDKEVKAGKASRELAATNREYKDNIIRSIKALRAGLVKLEIDFRTKPALKPFLPHVAGIIDDTGRAEDLSLEGRFNDSGKQLLTVIEKLTDVLVEMP